MSKFMKVFHVYTHLNAVKIGIIIPVSHATVLDRLFISYTIHQLLLDMNTYNNESMLCPQRKEQNIKVSKAGERLPVDKCSNMTV